MVDSLSLSLFKQFSFFGNECTVLNLYRMSCETGSDSKRKFQF